jgi:hypothetical protein
VRMVGRGFVAVCHFPFAFSLACFLKIVAIANKRLGVFG